MDILPHHSSTMHRRRHMHDKKYLWFHNQNLLKFFHNMPIISPRILTGHFHFSVIQFMNTHMIYQILPLLLMESTPQGITQENTVITVLTRHPNLNHRKLTERQSQEKMDDVIIHQTVIILPVSKEHIQDRRNHNLMRHSSKEPGG